MSAVGPAPGRTYGDHVTVRRYLLPEVVGAVLAVSVAWWLHRLTGTATSAAWGASLAEAGGFYGVLLWRDATPRPGVSRVRAMLAEVPGTIVEFGPAEAVDTLLIRPALMYAGPLLLGQLALGTLAGKLAADAVFYGLVVPGRRLRLRLFPNDPATPRLELDLGVAERAYRHFHGTLDEVAVHYAMKCNPEPALLRRLHRAGCSFEIASAPELAVLRKIGVNPADVLFSNPVKGADHIAKAHAAGVWRFAADSGPELAKLARYAPGCAVYVRMRTTAAGGEVGSEGKFGVPGKVAANLLREARRLGLRTYGLTFHVGSQSVDPTAWTSAIEECGAVMAELLDDDILITLLDLGGGFPARYEAEPPELADYAKHIRTAVAGLPYPVDLAAEPGRALVAAAGTMVATVIGLAERDGHRWAHLDVGAFNGMMEALESGNRLRFPVSDEHPDGPRTRYHLTGPTCDSQDTILYDVELSAGLAVGDTVRIHVAGAYTCAYASTFNGFVIPKVYCLA
jgi:ornithine decarboxylase